jgi:enoyl-CoA hydratase
MTAFTSIQYEETGKIARIFLNRPKSGNAITGEMPRELAQCVERANTNPDIHVIALAGNGSGFCGGYDLKLFAEKRFGDQEQTDDDTDILSRDVQRANHDPEKTWDPMIDYAMMSRNVKGFMSLFHSEKPVICKVHGFCVAGGTDMALCSDLLVIDEEAKIGYPPARVWGSPTTSMWMYRLGIEKAKRLLFTGDCLSGREAKEWGLAIDCAPLDRLDDVYEELLNRIARMPVNQLVMMKLLCNQALTNMGLHTTQMVGTVFDGITRHTPEGYAFQQRAGEIGFKETVRERDEPFGDFGLSAYKK